MLSSIPAALLLSIVSTKKWVRSPFSILIFSIIILFSFLGLKYKEFVILLVQACLGYYLILFNKKKNNSVSFFLSVFMPLCFLLIFNYSIFNAVKSFLVLDTLKILGISYFTFKQISLSFDHPMLGKITFIEYLSYLFYFPAFLAGPINHFSEFKKSSAKKHTLDKDKVIGALLRISFGLSKNIFILPLISGHTLKDIDVSVVSFPFFFLASLLSGLYIYVDFSSYCDMGIGISRLLGIHLPENFNSPFLSRNIQDFWNRWHMSLSNWLKTYLFNNLYKNGLKKFKKKNMIPVYFFSIFITFSLAGIWHGDGINYLLFGVFHGLGLGLLYLFKSFCKKRKRIKKIVVARPIAFFLFIINFLYISLGWVFFDLNQNQLLMLVGRL